MQQGFARNGNKTPRPVQCRNLERHTDAVINVVLTRVAHLAAVSTDVLPLSEEPTIFIST